MNSFYARNIKICSSVPQLASDSVRSVEKELAVKGGNCMTANQIAYQNLLEARRHNIAQEQENIRHNVRTEDLGFSNLSELSRHNLESEAINWYGEDIRGYGTYHNAVQGYRNLNVAQQQASASTSQAASAAQRAENDTQRVGIEQGQLDVREYEAQTNRNRQITDTVGMVWHNALDSVGMLPLTPGQWKRSGLK